MNVDSTLTKVQQLASSWIGLLIAIVVVYKVVQFLLYKYYARKLGCSPPTYISSDHMFGFKAAFELLKSKSNGTFPMYSHERFEKYGSDTAKMMVAGSVLFVTRDPENIKALLGTQFNDYDLGIRHRQFLPLLGDGIFTLDSQGWKHSRAMLRPQFAREQVAHVKMLEPHVKHLITHIKKYNGSKFDIQEYFFKLTLDSATEFLFGESVESLCDDSINMTPTGQCDPTLKQEFAYHFNYAQMTLASRAVLQDLYFLYNPGQFKTSCQKVHDLTDFFVNQALDTSKEELDKKLHGGYVFLYELVKQTRDPKVLRDQALNILLAGRDTTAGLLSFALFELSRNPKYWNKLRDEIEQHFGLGEDAAIEEITFEALKKCEYLKAFINETLRLYPSVPQNFRTANKHTSLPRGGGKDETAPIFIPKNTVITYPVFSTHRMTKYYGKDASEFRPERWFEDSTRKLGWAYLPFNGGPRICLGQQFALTEASYVLTRLVQLFTTLNPGEQSEEYPPKLNSQLTVCLEKGCHISLT